jgi:hypothetical protein
MAHYIELVQTKPSMRVKDREKMGDRGLIPTKVD